MPKKEWELAFGERGSNSSDPITEIIRRNMVAREQKKEKREDEIEELEHEAKVKELKGIEREPAPITFKPVEIDVQSGEKAAQQRAQMAEEQVTKERDKRLETQEKLEQERMANLRADFTRQLDDLKKLMAEGGAGSKQGFAEKLAEIKATAGELGYTKQAGGIPPEIQIQLQQMQTDLQIRLANMEDDRSRRDKEWQLSLMKYNDEKASNQQRLQQEIAASNERTQLMKGGLDTLGRIAGKAMVEGGGEVTQKTAARQYPLTADEGETGEFDCPGCGAKLYLAPDAMRVPCAKCGSLSSFTRTKTEAPPKEAKVEGEELAHPV